MKKYMLLILFITLCSCASIKNYEIDIIGIKAKHFKNRNPWVISLGVISYFGFHELGHVWFAKENGGGHFDWDTRKAVMENPESHNDIQMFYRSGFLLPMAIGGVLTLIPTTRHSDYALGLNGMATLNAGWYTLNDGILEIAKPDYESSDIYNLDHGVLEGTIYTGISGIFTYINLRKEEE